MSHSLEPSAPAAKAEMRKRFIARRDALPAAERTRIARVFSDKLAALPQYIGAGSILATMSIGSEWDTRAFIGKALAAGKSVVLPRISAPPRRLELFAVRDLERDLVPGVWDIPEPDPDRCPRVDLAAVDLAVVPALAADRAGYRLGYGAGYFDRLLSGRGKRLYCVCALPAAFILPRLFHETHDVPVDRVLDDQ